MIEELDEAVEKVRRRTRRPVGTTQPLSHYKGDSHLQTLGDWMFPDVLISLHNEVIRYESDADRYVGFFEEQAKDISPIAWADKRPLMLKSIRYPWGGIPGLSLAVQKRYFSGVMRTLCKPDSDWVAFAVHGAFDSNPGGAGGPDTWRHFTGLMEADGSARPAVEEILRRCP